MPGRSAASPLENIVLCYTMILLYYKDITDNMTRDNKSGGFSWLRILLVAMGACVVAFSIFNVGDPSVDYQMASELSSYAFSFGILLIMLGLRH